MALDVIADASVAAHAAVAGAGVTAHFANGAELEGGDELDEGPFGHLHAAADDLIGAAFAHLRGAGAAVHGGILGRREHRG